MMQQQNLNQDPAQQKRIRRTGMMAAGLVAAMVGLAYASVPLYELFCQVTGFGGTTQRAETAPDQVIDRIVKVEFTADVAKGLNWHFKPEQRRVELKVGEEKLAFYKARNTSDKPLTGTATFNVSPPKVGIYFSKIECFCFTEQTLAPGEEIQMPVAFFIDPEIAKDPEMDRIKTITLSYTFFPAKENAAKVTDKKIAQLQTNKGKK